MTDALLEKDFEKIFKGHLKITTRSIAVKTLLSDRNIRRINYKPYYQRNYVWDSPKASFFIESVLLGTEIPPLVFFKSGKNIEIIDGRQRFETLKRFKENDLNLSSKGLMKLQTLSGKGFNKIESQYREIFLDSKIRIFEFEVINEPKLNESTEDSIKKEIFRRYNTGITPLKTAEVDNAKYDDDDLTTLFKEDLNNDPEFLEQVKSCFFNKKRKSDDNFIAQIVDFYRRYIILTHFPISSYADGSNRTFIRELLYEFVTENEDDINAKFIDFKDSVNTILWIYNHFQINDELNNRLVYECLLWAVCVLKAENSPLELSSKNIEILRKLFVENIDSYSQIDSHYYKSILERFTATAKIFKSISDVDFSDYIRKEEFKDKIKDLKQSEEEASITLEELSDLRVHKPDPTSVPVEEIIESLGSTKYMVRPSYQRQEKINLQKASAIIESILLGVYLPPIFIYKNEDGLKEVIDGQQRLLSIMAFLGKPYKDDNGNLQYSKNNNFSLKRLKVLHELNGSKSSGLSEYQLDKIYDFDLSIIEIDHKVNPNFMPVDLFIRLNNKPYPIKENSFEMWNSTVDKSIIQKVKDITDCYVKWFYIRKTDGDKNRDRMENEEMIIILSYLSFIGSNINEEFDGLDIFLKSDRLNCRLKDKKSITVRLNSLASDPISKKSFSKCIDKTENFINKLGSLTSSEDSGETLNKILNVKGIRGFKRSLQDVYIIWLLINDIEDDLSPTRKDEILADIKQALGLLKNINDDHVDIKYINKFFDFMKEARKKYS